MKNIIVALITVLLISPGAEASKFEGGFAGATLGSNSSDISSGALATGSINASTAGIEAGYNWDVKHFLFGLEAFQDWNGRTDHSVTMNYGSIAYGLDAILGFPKGLWMPYARMGIAHTRGTGQALPINGDDPHYGLGIDYKLTPNMSLNAEYSTSAAKSFDSILKNKNFGIGFKYYFAEKKISPIPVIIHAPIPKVVIKAPEPVVVPIVPKPFDHIVLLPNGDGSPSALVMKTETGEEHVIDHPYETFSVVKGGKVSSVQETAEAVRSRYGATLAAMPKRAFNYTVHFIKGATETVPEPKVFLEIIKAEIKTHDVPEIIVIGHTDRVGSLESNDELSMERAKVIRDVLISGGIPAEEIEIAGRGEREPLIQTEDEVAEPRNRRAEIIVR